MLRRADSDTLETNVQESGGTKPKINAFSGSGRVVGRGGDSPQPPPRNRSVKAQATLNELDKLSFYKDTLFFKA